MTDARRERARAAGDLRAEYTDSEIVAMMAADYDARRASRWGRTLIWLLNHTTGHDPDWSFHLHGWLLRAEVAGAAFGCALSLILTSVFAPWSWAFWLLVVPLVAWTVGAWLGTVASLRRERRT